MQDLFTSLYGYPFSHTFLFALLISIPRWGWLIIGLSLGMFIVSLLTTMRDNTLIKLIKVCGVRVDAGYLVRDWILAMNAWRIQEVDRRASAYNTMAAELSENYRKWKSGYTGQVEILEQRVAQLTDERSALRQQLDKSHKRPRDARGYFVKAADAPTTKKKKG